MGKHLFGVLLGDTDATGIVAETVWWAGKFDADGLPFASPTGIVHLVN